MHTAAKADRLWIPTWLYPDDVRFPYHYWPCSRSMALKLRSAYRTTFWDARKLTTQLDELAIRTSALARSSPRTAATRRRPRASSPEPGTRTRTCSRSPTPGRASSSFTTCTSPEPTMLTRAQLADAAALDLITEATQAASRRPTVRDGSLGTWQHRTGNH